MNIKKPIQKPVNPKFATGPTTKRTGYSLANLDTSLLGRSHRSKEVISLFNNITIKLKQILNIPEEYKIVFTPGSDTAAMEIVLWNLIGNNSVSCLVWEHFGNMWREDLLGLQINNLNIYESPYGDYPNTSKVDFLNDDIIFTYCGTTSGVIFNEENKLLPNRKGLVITDATSYIFSEDIDWSLIDVTTFSWQKCLGGEAQTGILILSPRAIDRLNNYAPNRYIPHLFQLKKNNIIKSELLEGQTINTPSILSAIDFLDALLWVEKNGGMEFCKKKVNENFNVVKSWINKSSWLKFVPKQEKYYSKMSLCLKITDNYFLEKSREDQQEFLDNIHNYLSTNHIAYDIKSHRSAPAGIRLWAGATINKEDLQLLTQWLDFLYFSLKDNSQISKISRNKVPL